MESIATGLMAGIHAAALAPDEPPRPLPRETALGSLCHYISAADAQQLSARQHHLRPVAAARRSHAPRACAATNRRATLKSAAARIEALDALSPRPCLSLARRRSTRYLDELKRAAALRRIPSKLTARDLEQFLEYLSPPETEPPAPAPSIC